MQGNTSTYRPAAGVARAGVAGLLAVRLAIGIAIAFVVTFGLYYGMHVLITGSGKPPTEDNSFKIVDTRVPPEETEVQRKDRKPPKPKPPEEPPEPPKFDNVVSNKPNASATNMNFDFGANANISGGISFDAAQDRDVLPIVRVEPIYPQRAASRGIEGYVILEFTVLPSGEVDAESIQILEAEPSSIFNSASIRAVRKWKYKPKIENGKPVAQYGIRTRLTYELAD